MTAFWVAGVACMITLGGGAIALSLKAYRGAVLAFCAGVLVALALLEILPESLELLESLDHAIDHHHLLIAAALGFICFYFVEHLSHHHGRGEAGDAAHPHAHETGLWGVVGIAVHSLLDGVAIGQGFQVGGKIAWIVALAVMIHKLADGVSAVGIMLGTRHSLRTTVLMLAVTALTPIAGVLLQMAFTIPLALLLLMLCWFAGVFIYLGASSLLPAAHETNHSRWLPVVTFAGVFFVYAAHSLAE